MYGRRGYKAPAARVKTKKGDGREMGSDERKQELLNQMKEGVIEYDEDQVVEAANAFVDEGYDAYEGIMDGLAAGMEVVGELFDNQEYFVPEVLMCADALYAGLDILRPNVNMEGREQVRGEVVIGVVEGDVHDIGKNLVKMMFEVAGFTVHDLGADVPLDQFVEKQISTNSEIVALSAMMTTTMMGMKKAIANLKEKNPDVKIMIGGAPVTGEIADMFGADGYSENASNAVSEAIKMVGALRRM
ncbi:MAG: corrinoid protein [Thermoleophilia bacterium]